MAKDGNGNGVYKWLAGIAAIVLVSGGGIAWTRNDTVHDKIIERVNTSEKDVAVVLQKVTTIEEDVKEIKAILKGN